MLDHGGGLETAPQEVAVEQTVKEQLQRVLERITLQSQAQHGDGELLVQVWVSTWWWWWERWWV
uniref:Uncharacterized protein n=1 Tax=Oryza glumipatula TaxID=40148 RepID=A0A0E0AT68_9ORYZ